MILKKSDQEPRTGCRTIDADNNNNNNNNDNN
jgi:hypothetical protein